MFIARSRSRVLAGVSPALMNSYYAALLCAEIVHGDAGLLGQLLAQQRGECFDPCLDRVDAQASGVASGDGEADLVGDGSFPVFEPACIVAQLVGAGIGQGGGLEIDEGWLECSNDIAANVEEAGAAGASQVLAAWRREHVAADMLHIDGELADGLAGVEQIEDAVARRDAAYVGGRIDQSTLRGNVRDRDQFGARPDCAFERGEIELSQCCRCLPRRSRSPRALSFATMRDSSRRIRRAR